MFVVRNPIQSKNTPFPLLTGNKHLHLGHLHQNPALVQMYYLLVFNKHPETSTIGFHHDRPKVGEIGLWSFPNKPDSKELRTKTLMSFRSLCKMHNRSERIILLYSKAQPAKTSTIRCQASTLLNELRKRFNTPIPQGLVTRIPSSPVVVRSPIAGNSLCTCI